MITVPELAAQALGSFLAEDMTHRFGSTHARLTEVIPLAARLALDCIGNSDALYHNVEHTMLVTLAGYDIITGRALLTPTDANDFAHVIIACLWLCPRYSQRRRPKRLCCRRKGWQNETSARRFGRSAYALPRRPLKVICDGSPCEQ